MSDDGLVDNLDRLSEEFAKLLLDDLSYWVKTKRAGLHSERTKEIAKEKIYIVLLQRGRSKKI